MNLNSQLPMNKLLTSLLLALALAGATQPAAHAYSSSVDNLFVIIPDDDANGYQNSQPVSGVGGSVQHVSVTLNLSGGFNGDLYAYLFHNNTSAILLNRAGRSNTSGVGCPDAGFGPDAGANSFTFNDQASHDVHLYRSFAYTLNSSGQLTGQWQPDGRAIDPSSAQALFDSAPRASPLGVFNGMDPNGLWTLYLADVSPGNESALLGWGLIIEVPEPGSAILICFGLAGGLSWAWPRCRARSKQG